MIKYFNKNIYDAPAKQKPPTKKLKVDVPIRATVPVTVVAKEHQHDRIHKEAKQEAERVTTGIENAESIKNARIDATLFKETIETRISPVNTE